MIIDKHKNFKKIFLKIIIVIIVCAGVSVILISRQKEENIIPRWVTWNRGSMEDASKQYKIMLAQKKVSVCQGNDIIWTSPKDVKVQNALSGDIDQDGQDELVLLCWRKGHYGDVKPIWVTKDTDDWVQHIFVYEYLEEDVKAKWMSSYIGKDILDITTKETGTIGCFLCLTDTDGVESLWAWDSWGFVRVDTD